jgi:hypothetical protein
MARRKMVQRPFLPTSSPFRLPELQRMIEVMRHCMRRVVGISISLPGALHTVASQHISTLHNTSGRHILRYVPAQVKHHLFAACFLSRRSTQFRCCTRLNFDPRHSLVDVSEQIVARLVDDLCQANIYVTQRSLGQESVINKVTHRHREVSV